VSECVLVPSATELRPPPNNRGAAPRTPRGSGGSQATRGDSTLVLWETVKCVIIEYLAQPLSLALTYSTDRD